MAEPLQTYLHDHYSGATFAAELLEDLHDKFPGQELGRLAGEMLDEINHDRETLETIIHQIGSAGPDLRDIGAWVAEKISRLKLRKDDPYGLGVFEALEALSLGILGKRALWTALQRVMEVDRRIERPDFDTLAQQAGEQFNRVEGYRLRLAQTTFAGGAATVRVNPTNGNDPARLKV
jgi:hypothetical protein